MSETTEHAFAAPASSPASSHVPAWRGHGTVPVNLVLEGGAMRGQFTAGVLDFFMDQKLFCERVIGVSAGALCGYNYVAGEDGRTCYLNTKYCDDWRYLSMKSFVRTGNAAAYPYDEFYKNDDELTADIVAAYRQVIADLYAAGCRNVQFDDCTWTRLCDASVRERLGWSDEDALRLQQENLDVINAVIADQPDDLVINTHVCRGNFHSTWLSSGGYAPVAAKLFGEENVDAYYLEFDDDRSGDFAPLAEVSGDKKVVLGLITSKKPDLEDPDTIKARIQEAAQYIPLDRLCLSTQCGFASTQEGNKLTEDQQWAKIALVQSIAKDVWGE